MVQQSIDYNPEEERHDHGDEEDGFKQVPRAFGTRLAIAVAVAPPDLAAAVLAGCRIIAGVRHRRRDAAARRDHLYLAQFCHRLTGGVAMHLCRRRPLRRRLESRRRIHLERGKQSPSLQFLLSENC